MKIKLNKRIKLIIYLTIIFLIIGILLPSIMNKSLIKSRVDNYISNLIENKVSKNKILLRTSSNNLVENSLISFMPLPINILVFIIKIISIGSSITSILITYKLKGILYLPIIIPNLLSLIILSISLYYSITYFLIRKRNINKKKLIKEYLFIYLITTLLLVIVSIIETYLSLYYFPLFR